MLIAGALSTGVFADDAPTAPEPDGWERPQLNAGGEAPYRHEINLYDYDGVLIDPKTSTEPYSPAITCGKCHDIAAISCGSHFDAGHEDEEDKEGRSDEPWWVVDSRTQTQIPLSLEASEQVQSLETLGLTPWSFTLQFGGYTPGGGLGAPDDPNADPSGRWALSGQLEIDCLICHLNSHEYDFSAWNQQIERQNLRWAPTAASGFASVKGAAKNLADDYDPEMDMFGENADSPVVTWDERRFNAGKRIVLDLVAHVPNENCYRCHSNEHVGRGAPPAWQVDEDIHVARGIACVDCHRHGIDHQMLNGDPHATTPGQETLTCVGCHYGVAGADEKRSGGGRLGAPRPDHAGLPPLHFEKLTCTACHSGPRPTNATLLTQTSRAHRLGESSEHRTSMTLPHLVSPLWAENEHGELAPYRAGWPAFWGRREGEDLAKIKPLTVTEVEAVVVPLLEKPEHAEDWRSLSHAEIKKVLTQLGADAVYVAGGRVYTVSGEAIATTEGLPAAQPAMWSIGHNVRPAADALGSGGCTDCHAKGAPIDFALTANRDWPQSAAEVPTIPIAHMQTLREHDLTLAMLWNTAFTGRSVFKAVAWAAWSMTVFVALAAALATAIRFLIRYSGEKEKRA